MIIHIWGLIEVYYFQVFPTNFRISKTRRLNLGSGGFLEPGTQPSTFPRLNVVLLVEKGILDTGAQLG